MSLSRPKYKDPKTGEMKQSKVWVMDFHYQGQRIRESTCMTSKTRAREVQDKRKQELREGAAGINRQRNQPKLLSFAAKEWMDSKTKWSPSMRSIAETALTHLSPVFGKKLLVDIEGPDVTKYQRARQALGASNRTINIEIGCLRAIMRKFRAWDRIRPDVEMLPERSDAGHALTADEESILLAECGKSRSRVLHPFVVLAIETAARYGTIRRLQWKNVDFKNECLTFGKDKTRAGTGRTIPLSKRAVETLRFWADRFPDRIPEHFVFAFERYGGSGASDVFGFKTAAVYQSDPTRPIGSVKKAWEQARKRANLEHVRIHDLRHTGVSRLIAAGVPLPMIAKMVGWSAGTLAKMSARYGHFSLEEMRSAVEAASRKTQPNVTGYPQFSPQLPANSGNIVQ